MRFSPARILFVSTILVAVAIESSVAQLETLMAVGSVVPITSILATAGVLGLKIAAVGRLLRAFGYGSNATEPTTEPPFEDLTGNGIDNNVPKKDEAVVNDNTIPNSILPMLGMPVSVQEVPKESEPTGPVVIASGPDASPDPSEGFQPAIILRPNYETFMPYHEPLDLVPPGYDLHSEPIAAASDHHLITDADAHESTPLVPEETTITANEERKEDWPADAPPFDLIFPASFRSIGDEPNDSEDVEMFNKEKLRSVSEIMPTGFGDRLGMPFIKIIHQETNKPLLFHYKGNASRTISEPNSTSRIIRSILPQ